MIKVSKIDMLELIENLNLENRINTKNMNKNILV
jgi:hypothetical protein